MKSLAAVLALVALATSFSGPGAGQNMDPEAPGASDQTQLTIHNVRPAHQISLGAGTRVGLLDRAFGMGIRPDLYAGEVVFLAEPRPDGHPDMAHHGYWMASALREIAPEADVFALEIPMYEEGVQVEAMIRALDWAVENDLDVVTYCGKPLSAEAQKILDPVVERTVEAGVVVAFTDYPHPLNLFPGGFGPPAEEHPRAPDLNIFSYDCTALLAREFSAFVDPDDDRIQREKPFLSRPSTGSVTAGLVALLRSVAPEASPAQVKKILVQTSRPLVYRGRKGARVPDAVEALNLARSVGT